MSVLNKKRKTTQNDLRLQILEKKRKLTETRKKVDLSLAKYLDDVTLQCLICNSIIRTEAIWNMHINSKQHRYNVIQRRQSKGKFSISPTESINTTRKKEPVAESTRYPVILRKEGQPAQLKNMVYGTTVENMTNQMDVDEPLGFFDDLAADVKTRNSDFKHPIDEEWYKFQRESQEESVSSELHLEHEKNAAIDKVTEHIVEQIQCCSRVQMLERKEKFETNTWDKVSHSLLQTGKDEDVDSSYGSDEDLDEHIDW